MSTPRVTRTIPEGMVAVLDQGLPALLLTVGRDGYPGSAFTWVVGVSAERLHFGVDHGTATLANLEAHGRCAIQVITRGNRIYLVKGIARPAKERLEAAPFKMGMWTLDVEEVKDQSWPGVTVLPLGYEWSPDQRDAMLAVERQVFQEMKAWTGN